MVAKAKIFLGILILFIVVLVAINFFYLKPISLSKLPLGNLSLSSLWQKTPLAVPTNVPKQNMFLPVRRSDLANIPEAVAKADHLIFFLSDKTPVYALFSGKIRLTEAYPPKVPFTNIQIISLDGRYVANYIFEKSKVYVQDGQSVSTGNLIAEVKKGEGLDCLGGGNLGIYLSGDNQPAVLNKAVIEALKGVGE